MASDTRQGRADHRAVELFERMAQVADKHRTSPERFLREIKEEIILDAAIRFWERRGYYHVQEVDHAD